MVVRFSPCEVCTFGTDALAAVPQTEAVPQTRPHGHAVRRDAAENDVDAASSIATGE